MKLAQDFLLVLECQDHVFGLISELFTFFLMHFCSYNRLPLNLVQFENDYIYIYIYLDICRFDNVVLDTTPLSNSHF